MLIIVYNMIKSSENELQEMLIKTNEQKVRDFE